MKPYHCINYSSLLCLNLIKNPLLECAMTCKKIDKRFQIFVKKNKKFRYKNYQNAKKIKESKDLLSRNY